MINNVAQTIGLLVIGIALGVLSFRIFKFLLELAVDDDRIINIVKSRIKKRSHGNHMLTDDIEEVIDDRLLHHDLIKEKNQ